MWPWQNFLARHGFYKIYLYPLSFLLPFNGNDTDDVEEINDPNRTTGYSGFYEATLILYKLKADHCRYSDSFNDSHIETGSTANYEV